MPHDDYEVYVAHTDGVVDGQQIEAGKSHWRKDAIPPEALHLFQPTGRTGRRSGGDGSRGVTRAFDAGRRLFGER